MHMLAMFFDDNTMNPQNMTAILAAVAGFYLVVFLIVVVVLIIPTWFICKKAGFSPWLSLLIIIPFGGLVLLYVLAFSEWTVAPAATAVAAWQPPPPPAPPQV
jgi:cytochrome c biogenesis protein CcdA